MFVCVCVHTSDAYMLYHCYTKLSGVAVLCHTTNNYKLISRKQTVPWYTTTYHYRNTVLQTSLLILFCKQMATYIVYLL